MRIWIWVFPCVFEYNALDCVWGMIASNVQGGISYRVSSLIFIASTSTIELMKLLGITTNKILQMGTTQESPIERPVCVCVI